MLIYEKTVPNRMKKKKNNKSTVIVLLYWQVTAVIDNNHLYIDAMLPSILCLSSSNIT